MADFVYWAVILHGSSYTRVAKVLDCVWGGIYRWVVKIKGALLISAYGIHLIKFDMILYHMNLGHSVNIIAIPPAGVWRFLGIYPPPQQVLYH